MLVSQDAEKNEFVELVESHAKKVVDIWHSISNLCGNIFERIEENLANPFIREAYFTEQPHYMFQILLSCIEISLNILRDSLGRTSLHVTTSLLTSEYWSLRDWESVFKRTDEALLDATDKFGNTPLHVACIVDCCGGEKADLQIKVIKTLLKANVKTNIRNGYGLLAIEYAILGNRTDILETFREIRGLDISEIVSAIDDAQTALKKARGIVQGKLVETEESDLSTGNSSSDAELSEKEETLVETIKQMSRIGTELRLVD
ncbi:hypothetical protein GGR58DRAFT_43942 [Xylaria digitata]|nr:hypothetical protein GGR58DRAFT_43942 [Xylaria digitata]